MRSYRRSWSRRRWWRPAFVLVGIRLLALAAPLICGAAAPLAASTPAPGSPSPAQRAAAGMGALRPLSQSVLQALVASTARTLGVPGALVLLRTPQGQFTASYGTTLLGTATPPGPGTYFRIASNTKTMTAAVILQLAQEHRLSLADPISRYVAGVPGGDSITITQLLDMRSGLYNFTNAPALSASIDREPTRIWTTQQLLDIAFAQPPGFAPGSAYEYCNTNYLLLGLVIEKLDAKPLARVLHDRLFAPLGLQHTLLPGNTVNTLPAPYSHGYLYGSSSVALVGEPAYTAAIRSAARAGTLLPNDYTDVNHSFAGAAGGVISTASDLASWIAALVSGRVLNAGYQQRWLESPLPADPSHPDAQRYGYGIDQLRWAGNTVYFHGGETAGYNSFMGYDPASRMTLVIWTNLTVSLDGDPTANALMLKVLDRLYAVSPLTPAPAAGASR